MRSWQTPLVVLICGTTLLLISFGARQNFGLYMAPISTDLGWGRGVFSLAVAIQSLVWGVSTPVMGYLADRYGPARVLALGGTLYAAGLYLMAQATVPIDATISIGLLTGFALSMTGFPIVLSVIGRMVSAERRSLWLGIASAGGSSGQLVLVPFGQVLINEYGWMSSLVILAAMVALIVPLAYALSGGNKLVANDPSTQRIGEALKEASGHSGYKLLVTGYFVCGFQVMFMGAHLPAYLTDLGLSAELGATALALIGLMNVIGCIVWGQLGNQKPKKYLLTSIYLGRAVVMSLFMLIPVTPLTVIVFAITMGAIWLATVPLTTALVAQIFGTKFMATLVGITFFSHQLGSFLGIYLGGWVYDTFGSYDPIFWGGAALGLVAAALHFPINDKPIDRSAMQAPATA